MTGESLRVGLIFACAGVCVVAILGRLAWLQGACSTVALAKVSTYQDKELEIPARRGEILDRRGESLAFDRPVYTALAEIYFPRDPEANDADRAQRLELGVQQLVSDLGLALAEDPDLSPGADQEQRQRLAKRLEWRMKKPLEVERVERAKESAAGRVAKIHKVKVDLLVAGGVDHGDVIAALKKLDRWRNKKLRGKEYYLKMHLRHRFERVYPNREYTAGVVGFMVENDPAAGLEKLGVLASGTPGHVGYMPDAVGTRYWSGRREAPEEPRSVRTTLDMRLQALASDYLAEAVANVQAKYKLRAPFKGRPEVDALPEWGGLILVDVKDGGIVAIAGYERGPDGENSIYGTFAPIYRQFEPGSVVKPLTLAMGLEAGVIDWNQTVDCRRGFRLAYRRARREIKDSHDCYDLDPLGVIVNSSNIGAVRLGMKLGSEGLDQFFAEYQFGTKTQVLPIEAAGKLPFAATGTKLRTPLYELPPNEQEVYTVPSICFGYGFQATIIQVSRAYLSLVSGRRRQLRLVSHVGREGAWEACPDRDADTEPFLSQLTIGRILEAMEGVVTDVKGATGRHLAKMLLDDHGVEPGWVGGKTGTSEYPVYPKKGQKVMVRTSSFVGVVPVKKPRYLVVCVLQKEGARAFYGGSYAAPAAGKLLLEAMRREKAWTAESEAGQSSPKRKR